MSISIRQLFRTLPFFGLSTERILIFAVVSAFAALFEGLGMAMFLPVLDYIEKGQNIEHIAQASSAWQTILALFRSLGLNVNLGTLLVAAILCMLVRVLAIYLRQLYSAWLGQEVQHSARSKLFEAYLGMDYEYATRQSSGGQINILTTESARAAGSFKALFAFFSNALVVLCFIAFLTLLSWQLTLVTAGLLVTSVLLVTRFVKKSGSTSHMAAEANAKYSRLVLERLKAFRLIKSTATSSREAEKGRLASGRVRDLFYALQRLNANVDLTMESIAVLCGGTIIFVSIASLGMSLSELTLFIAVLLRMLPVSKEMMKSLQSYTSTTGSLSALINGYFAAREAKEGNGGDLTFSALKESIELRRVCFRYFGSESLSLENISLTIPAGKVTAIVGPSGSGKTTLIDVITGLRRPLSGSILFDGVAIGDFSLMSLRESMSVVSQDSLILDATVAENLRYACPDADDDALWNALFLAHADEFVKASKDGLGANLGEGGVMLSGGQRQRIALARALLKHPSLLILDEPTSALDSETEQDITQTLEMIQKSGEVTTIVIAHRLSTVKNADNIIVLRAGCLVEQGSHKELLVSEEWYSRVAGLQSAF